MYGKHFLNSGEQNIRRIQIYLCVYSIISLHDVIVGFLYNILYCCKVLTLILATRNEQNMARTKQTPRNPIRDRPIATVGNDICSTEGRLLLRKTNQGKVLCMGGEQPRKSLARKLPCLHTPLTIGIKKPHQYRPGLIALHEIRRYQKSTECLIKRSPFQKLIWENIPRIPDMPPRTRNPIYEGEVPVNCNCCFTGGCRKLYCWTL